MQITGKRVLITGANRGLGKALALACARADASEIIACARNLESLSALEASTRGLAARITQVKLDVTSDDEVARAADGVGRVDILINSAGISVFGGFLKASLEEIKREIDINFLGPVRLVRAFAPAMAEYGDGLIVNIASQLSKVAIPMLGSYCATKAGVLSMTQAIRGDLAPSGVRVISILPGTLDTDMARGYDIPKTSADSAALEILEAIRTESRETAVCDDARKLLSDLAADPVGVEEALSQLRA